LNKANQKISLFIQPFYQTTMKKLLLTASVTMFLLTSCKKDQNEKLFANSSFTGDVSSARGGGGSGGTSFGGVELGGLTDNLFVFTNGGTDANWQGATKGFIGDAAINGNVASERTSGYVPYAGTISTNAANLSAWQNIVGDNTGQASSSLNQTGYIDSLHNDLESAFTQINALPVTTGYAGITPQSLDGFDSQNGTAETFVFNISSGFQVTTQINITGDANDIFIFRWDTDQNFSNGYNGTVKFQSGGAIVPHGGLTAGNFAHVAGNISSSGGGNNPDAPYPQGPRTNNGTGSLINGGSDFHGGGFFTGFWLTTGSPTIFPPGEQPYGQTSSLSNAIFVGGWYSKTVKFSMTSGTSGVHVAIAGSM
jgi:hypothetical protein